MKKLIFVDRDGVINKDPGGWTKYNYVTKWEEFFFIEGSIEALRKLKDAGYTVCLVSNQGGISKGYFTQADLDKINEIYKTNEPPYNHTHKVYCLNKTSYTYNQRTL